ncbi:MAG: hypothetical protein H6510_10080 [Acidobacteria bacterium]|nr:hypothetical protein [Acidobacteriota bacterium]MCB9398156.1 hypothetical protein [Acidobacteriota bacterium]
MLTPKALIFSLKTKNLDSLVGFYRNLIGRPSASKDGEWAQFEMGPYKLVIWRTEDPYHNTLPSLQLCFQVDDLDAIHRWIHAYSAPSPIMESSIGRECMVLDPDDNPIIIYQASDPQTSGET